MVHGQKRVKFDRGGNVILLEHAFSQKLNCGTQVIMQNSETFPYGTEYYIHKNIDRIELL